MSGSSTASDLDQRSSGFDDLEELGPEHLELEEASPTDAVDHHQVVVLGRGDDVRTFANTVDHAGAADEDGRVHIQAIGDVVIRPCGLQEGLVDRHAVVASVNADDAAGFLGAVALGRGFASVGQRSPLWMVM